MCRVLVVMVLLMCSACTTTSFDRAASAPRYPAYEGTVEVLYEFPPPDTYKVLGVVLISGARYTRQSAMMDDLLATAAKNGANAVVMQGAIVQPDDQDPRTRLAGTAIRVGQ